VRAKIQSCSPGEEVDAGTQESNLGFFGEISMTEDIGHNEVYWPLY